MNRIKKILLTILVAIAMFIAILLGIVVYLYHSADYLEPEISIRSENYQVNNISDSVRICNDNTLIMNKYGLWEAHIDGDATARGGKYGALTKDLLLFQEQVFVNQIHEIISSEWWVEILHKIIAIFNRNIAQHIPDELRTEIHALSTYGTDDYNNYGTSYVRQINYHAAHDIGHTLQEYMLVGCSSFATWGNKSEARKLIVARNFDFFVGEDFAKNKIVLFVEPTEGYKFASVTWPGMMGVLSGMNEKGLTITINAAKGALPTSSAMPISLLTRQILQYAQNIEEAYEIATQNQTFVSESILIGSAQDYCAAIIEKSPEKTSLFVSADSCIICTNHYQSSAFAEDEYNIDNIATSDSKYRQQRINELIEGSLPIDTEKAAQILRNTKGLNNTDIGLTNEKAINQYIGHHSVVFAPEERKMWVSTSPFQIGEMVCYDLNEVFANKNIIPHSTVIERFNIAADSCAISSDYPQVVSHKRMSKEIREAIKDNKELPETYIDSFINNNPNFFDTYNLAGDYKLAIEETEEAVTLWKQALTKEIPRLGEEQKIESKIKQYDKR